MKDFAISNHGSVYLLTPISEEAATWVEENLPEDRQTWGSVSVVVEARYISDIIAGITNDGYSVSL